MEANQQLFAPGKTGTAHRADLPSTHPSFFKNIFKNALCLALLFAAGGAFAQSTWTGATNTDWHTATNWSTAAVPTAADDVIIADVATDPTIGAAAVAKSVVVNSSAVLTVAAAGSLTINGSIFIGGFTNSLRNLGTVNNNGTITIGTTATVGQMGIVNQGTFNNNANSVINIDNITIHGFRNQGGTTNNSGQIIIGTTAFTGVNGLENRPGATFNNLAGGQIKVDRCTDSGIGNEGSFINNGNITAGSVAGFGNNCISNFSNFQNMATGVLQLDRAITAGLANSGAGIFDNAGTITMGSLNAIVASEGLKNQGIFNNNPGGQIHIDRTSVSGMINESGTFTNSATITIGANANVGFQGIQNQSTFLNAACAIILMHHRLANSSSFTNSGLFWVNTAISHTNSGTVTNNGIIEYPQGNPIPGVVNNEIIARPISGSSPISSALSLGGTVDFTIASNWFLNQNLTGPAGTYNQAANTFTNTNVPPGVPTTVYFSVNDPVGGCARTASALITMAAVPPPTGASPQTFCAGSFPTVAQLAATGTAIKWYAAASGGSPLPSWMPLVNGNHYFASQTVAGYESATRLDVLVSLTPSPAMPIGPCLQAFCAADNATIGSLLPMGLGLSWFNVPTGGAALPLGTLLVNGGNYYVSTTAIGCESPRLHVMVTVTTPLPGHVCIGGCSN